MDPQEENLIRRSIGAPEIDVLPGQQQQSNLPTGTSTEMRENRSQAEIIKQKTAEIPPAVGNADDPDAITPAEASTSSSENRTNPTATIGIESRRSVRKAASESALGSINRKTNVGPGGDMTEKKTGIVDIFPDPPKDDPKKSVEEVAQPIAA
ncbi:hypothetical protein FPCIR_800 [Fusarium pseudocircinatum]|uniref:Uncharacterized protein n=1 Tax=Fusarium pseudocircinatum TaxID=56676 RepID=A0A8H5PWT8_9HYPO|nr:hypothetical protein FPCIR_800 [Fusarium pseudocircinatum]